MTRDADTTVAIPAKFTPPRPSNLLSRKRLLARFRHPNAGGLIWIDGPPGAGKTSLAACACADDPTVWLTLDPGDADLAMLLGSLEHAALLLLAGQETLSIPAVNGFTDASRFARIFFRKLYRQHPPGLAVVLDNAEWVAASDVFAAVVREALAQRTCGSRVVVTSREPPPPALARFRVNGILQRVDGDDLRLTRPEARALARMRGHPKVPLATVERHWRMSEGWTAGFVALLTASAGRLNHSASPAPQLLWDYLDSEFLDTVPRLRRRQLIRLATLPAVSEQGADALLGDPSITAVLARLAGDCRFVTRSTPAGGPVYRFHPLLHEHLRRQLTAEFDADAIQALQIRAATVCERERALDSALDLYLDARQWDEATRLIVSRADAWLNEGQCDRLQGWIGRLPGRYLDECPWLRLWLGVCRRSADPEAGQQLLEAAFHSFRTFADEAGAAMAWCYIVETCRLRRDRFGALDHWLNRLPSVPSAHPGDMAKQITVARLTVNAVTALMLRRPWDHRLTQWVDIGHGLLKSAVSAQQRLDVAHTLLQYYCWLRGDRNRARQVLEYGYLLEQQHSIPSLLQLMWRCAETGYYLWFQHDTEPALTLAQQGLARAKKSAAHSFEFRLCSLTSYAALAAAKPDQAQPHLARMQTITASRGPADTSTYVYHLGWRALLSGDPHLALTHAREALALTQRAGNVTDGFMAQLAVAQSENACDNPLMALTHARQVYRRARANGSLSYSGLALLSAALAARQGGHARLANALLEAGLAYKRRSGFELWPYWTGDQVAAVMTQALRTGVNSETAQRVLSQHRPVSQPPPPDLARWPWPLRIRTFGRFELQRAGHSVNVSAARPLDLLQALIALGGNQVRQTQLTDVLWPDAEGDQARRIFDTTLFRLRQLLAEPNALRLHGGRLSLNRRLCWVDLRAFEFLTSPAGSATENSVQRALALYRGEFLEDCEAPWAQPLRRRMRLRFEQLINAHPGYLPAARCGDDDGARSHRSRHCEAGAKTIARAPD